MFILYSGICSKVLNSKLNSSVDTKSFQRWRWSAARAARARRRAGCACAVRAVRAARCARCVPPAWRAARATPHAAAAPDHWYRGYSTDSAECLPIGKSWTPIKIWRQLDSKSMIKIN